MQITFSLTGSGSPALYRVDIKADPYHRAVQVCYIPILGDIYTVMYYVTKLWLSPVLYYIVRVSFKTFSNKKKMNMRTDTLFDANAS